MQYIFVAIFAVSCLMHDNSAEKALRGGSGKTRKELDKDRKKLTKEMERERGEAKKTFDKRCGSVLKRPKWMQSEETANGFFVYETKSLACERKQMVLIDVKAAHYMEANYLTCDKSRDKRFLLKIPKSAQVENREIMVDCNTKLLDIGIGNGGTLHLATIERNGTTQKAVLNDTGRWDGTITTVASGFDDSYDLHHIHANIVRFHREGTLGYKMEQFEQGIKDYFASAAKGAVAAGLGALEEILDEYEQDNYTTIRPLSEDVDTTVNAALVGALKAVEIEYHDQGKRERINRAALSIARQYVRREG